MANRTKSARQFVFLVGALMVLAMTTFVERAVAAIPASERQALLDLYASTNGNGWNDHTNWNGAPGTECTWHGVTCDGGQTTVQDLELANTNLVGTLPATLGNLH